jgi:hypothetical protein
MRAMDPTCPLIPAFIRECHDWRLPFFWMRGKDVHRANVYTYIASVAHLFVKYDWSEHKWIPPRFLVSNMF